MSTFAPANRRLQPRFDVCVVGGGPAGAAAALAARSRGATVGLIAPPPQRATGSLELLAGRARRTLATLGLLDLVSSVAEPCVGTVNRWAGTGFDEQSCLLDPDGAGWIADRGRLDAALRATAAESGVTVVAERALHVDAQTSGELARVHLRHHDIRADAVIVAVGRARGPVRRHIRRNVRHRVVAIGARLEPGVITGLGVRLLIDRAANGWWYALADTAQTDIVYCTDAVELAGGGGRADMVWRQACRSAADWLPAAAGTARRSVRPATIGAVTPLVTGRVRLAGDTALAVDPLSGHGLTLALEAAARCTEPDYPDWVADSCRAHERMERDVYRAACGALAGPFWTRRRA